MRWYAVDNENENLDEEESLHDSQVDDLDLLVHRVMDGLRMLRHQDFLIFSLDWFGRETKERSQSGFMAFGWGKRAM